MGKITVNWTIKFCKQGVCIKSKVQKDLQYPQNNWSMLVTYITHKFMRVTSQEIGIPTPDGLKIVDMVKMIPYRLQLSQKMKTKPNDFLHINVSSIVMKMGLQASN